MHRWSEGSDKSELRLDKRSISDKVCDAVDTCTHTFICASHTCRNMHRDTRTNTHKHAHTHTPSLFFSITHTFRHTHTQSLTYSLTQAHSFTPLSMQQEISDMVSKSDSQHSLLPSHTHHKQSMQHVIKEFSKSDAQKTLRRLEMRHNKMGPLCALLLRKWMRFLSFILSLSLSLSVSFSLTPSSSLSLCLFFFSFQHMLFLCL